MADNVETNTGDDRGGKRARQPLAESERRTLFVSGIPPDATYRELRNMFAFASGFVQVQQQSDKPQNLFALFENQEDALKAVETLKDYKFSDGVELRPSLAKGNLKESKQGGEFPRPMKQMPQEYAALPQPLMSWDYSSYMPQVAPYPTAAQMPTPELYTNPFSTPVQPQPLFMKPVHSAPAPAPRAASRANGANAPCDTLFLRDISVTEAQVQSVAASLGCINSKFMKSSAGLAAFVQFDSPQKAQDAIMQLQGPVCSKAEFSKNPLGKRSRE